MKILKKTLLLSLILCSEFSPAMLPAQDKTSANETFEEEVLAGHVVPVEELLAGRVSGAKSVYSVDEPHRPVTSSLSLGIGRGKMRDTYLTPLLYQGTALDLHFDRSRVMRGLKWSNLQMADLSFTDGDDTASGLTSAYALRLRYSFAMHKFWRFPTSLSNKSLEVGPYFGIDFGGNYNLRIANGNNPATLRLAEGFGLSAAATWVCWPFGHPCPVNFTVQMPLIGTAFVPEYGASYYETFYLETAPNETTFTSLHNRQDLTLRLTTDVPFAVIPWLHNGSSLRLGLGYHIETMDINDIVTRYSTFQLVVGWSWKYLPYKYHRP